MVFFNHIQYLESILLGDDINKNELLYECINDFNNLKQKIILQSISLSNNIVMEIHAGSGGQESCDWVNMLNNMYNKWCKYNNYKLIEIDKREGIENTGYRSITNKIKGDNVLFY